MQEIMKIRNELSRIISENDNDLSCETVVIKALEAEEELKSILDNDTD